MEERMHLILKVDHSLIFTENSPLLQSSNTCYKEITFLKAPLTAIKYEI